MLYIFRNICAHYFHDPLGFQDFFFHPFVELEQAATSTILKNAISIVTDAIRADTENRVSGLYIVHTHVFYVAFF